MAERRGHRVAAFWIGLVSLAGALVSGWFLLNAVMWDVCVAEGECEPGPPVRIWVLVFAASAYGLFAALLVSSDRLPGRSGLADDAFPGGGASAPLMPPAALSLTASYSAEPIRLGHVRSGGAALRDQPGEGQVIRNLAPGTRVVVREWQGDFAYVFVDGGDRGWLHRMDLAEPVPKPTSLPGAQAAGDGKGGGDG